MLVVENSDPKGYREQALHQAVLENMEQSIAFVEDTYSAVHQKQFILLSGAFKTCKRLASKTD